MARSGELLLLALATGCHSEPVLGPDIDLAALASASASVAAPPLTSAVPPPAASASLIRQEVSGFPGCAVEPPSPSAPRWQHVVGDQFRGRTIEIRSAGDELYGADQIGSALRQCLWRSDVQPSTATLTIGILPSGRICEPQVTSSLTLPPQCLACFARRLHEYRFAKADRSSGICFRFAFAFGAPRQLSNLPSQNLAAVP